MSPPRQRKLLEPKHRRQAVHRQGRRLLQARALRDLDHRGGRDDQQLRLRAPLGAPRRDRGHHLLARNKAIHARADQLDDARGVHPRRPRQRDLAAATLAKPNVGRVDRRRLHRDPHLPVCRLTNRTVNHLQDLGPSGPVDADRPRHDAQPSPRAAPPPEKYGKAPHDPRHSPEVGAADALALTGLGHLPSLCTKQAA